MKSWALRAVLNDPLRFAALIVLFLYMALLLWSAFQVKESFTTAATETTTQTPKTLEYQRDIILAYQNVYDRYPTKSELTQWTERWKLDTTMTRTTLEKQLTTEKILGASSTIGDPRKAKPSEVYNQITEMYERILERIPKTKEIDTAFNKLRDPKTSYNYNSLRVELLASDEYRRMVKAQSNVVGASTKGIINHHQLENTIIKIYQGVVGANPTTAVIDFLREKYLDTLNQDDDKLDAYIRKLENKKTTKDVKAVETDIPKMTSVSDAEDVATIATTTAKAASTTTTTTAKAPAKTPTKPTEAATNPVVVFNQPTIYFNASSKAEDYLIASGVSKMWLSGMVNDQSTTDDDEAKRQCKERGIKETLLANATNNRNLEELKLAADRSSKYTNADDSGKLRPEFAWAVPQPRPPVCYGTPTYTSPQMSQSGLIGTLLEDANKTSVGSIMPPFELNCGKASDGFVHVNSTIGL
jgi:hypothetical protein